MHDLEKQEQFELEVLDKLNSIRILNQLVFCGGTMLRLCYGLNRFSVDLDFWIDKEIDGKELYVKLKDHLSQSYVLTDSANKYNTILFELKFEKYPRSLKIEIRKETKKIGTEQIIAFSKYSDKQVLVKAVCLEDVMKSKIQAFMNRKEIRDVFDIEFLVKRGIEIKEDKEIINKVLKLVQGFTKNDYAVKLGSLLEQDQRNYYKEKKFEFLEMYLKKQITQ